MNSWDDSDTTYEINGNAHIGPNDLGLGTRLSHGGNDHGKFTRMIICWCDITAPLYWWKEFDTYRVGVEKNSCSTMHKVHCQEFEPDMFSHEHLITGDEAWNAENGDDFPDTPQFAGSATTVNGDRAYFTPGYFLKMTCDVLNRYRKLYLENKDKMYWWQIIQLLPSSYNQRRTVMMSYQALSNIYHQRRHHKLDEWLQFCDWVETLPYASDFITHVDKQ
jgi:hypothetical protein